MKNFKISKKLTVAFGVIFLFFAATVITGILGMNTLSANFTTFYNGPFVAAKQAIDMRRGFQEMEKYIVLSCTTENTRETQQYIDQCTATINALNESVSGLKSSFTGDQKLIEEFESILAQGAPVREKLYELSLKGDNEGAVRLYNEQYSAITQKARDILAQVGDAAENNAQDFYNQGVTAQKRAFSMLIIFTLLSAAMILLFCIYIIKSITKPVSEIEAAADRMSKGDLSAVISYVSKDELGMLANSMRTMMDNLRSYVNNIDHVLGRMARGDMTVSIDLDYIGDFAAIKESMIHILESLNNTLIQINTSSEQVASGSEQVSSGAQALSQGATEQASSIEELSAGIAEISEQVKRNAQNAQQADLMVSETTQEITLGNQQMENLVSAMDQISQTSNQISKIIKTIDDIAFQTNILALNAAVEAARAGAAGKGFAVVADEVRNLAGKSAEAAKDTTTLIENAIKAVSNGMEMADKTAKSLNGIVGKADSLAHIMNEIATASNDQATAVIQTTTGVDQISGVIQTNSATAEESAAASEELSGQAQVLKQLVSGFKLRNSVNAAEASAPPASGYGNVSEGEKYELSVTK